jgi:hypothetical protein
MRSTEGFNDGRVYVTLFDGALDLHSLRGADRMVWRVVHAAFLEGADLARMESFSDASAAPSIVMRLRHREPLASLYSDLCRRVALEESGLSALVEELLPWRPAESRARYELALGYHPALTGALAA